jgi:hypothetical protein
MDSAEFLTALANALRPLVEHKRGTLTIADDPDHVIDLLAGAAPAGWRLILSYAGDDAMDDNLSPGIVRWNMNATVQAGTGLSRDSQSATHTPNAAGRKPLLALADQVSQWVRGLTGDSSSLGREGFSHRSRSWLAVEGIPTRQLNIVFRVPYALPKPVSVPVSFP